MKRGIRIGDEMTHLHLVDENHLGLGNTREAGEEGDELLEMLQSLLLTEG